MADASLGIDSEQTGWSKEIAMYIHTDVFDPMKQDRRLDETRWQDSLDCVQGVDIDLWKEGEAGAEVPSKNDTEPPKDEDQSWRSHDYYMLAKTKWVASRSVIQDMMIRDGDIPFKLLEDPDYEQMERPEDAEKGSEMMSKIIKGQYRDAKADREFMHGLSSLGLYGEGWLEAPVIITINKLRYILEQNLPPGTDLNNMDPRMVQQLQQYQRYVPEMQQKIIPGIRYKSIWVMFKDKEFDNPHDGRAIIELEDLSLYDMFQKKSDESYDQEAIKEVIEQNSKNKAGSSTDYATRTPLSEML